MRLLNVAIWVGLVTVSGCGRADGDQSAPTTAPASNAGVQSAPAESQWYPLKPYATQDSGAPASTPPPPQGVDLGAAAVDSSPHNTESYDSLEESRFLTVGESPLSTFSIDVDTASYANVRRFLNSGSLPRVGAVRIEELINYFPYQYTPPLGNDPFAVNAEVAACPWKPEHQLVRIGLKGRVVDHAERPPCQLVFLIDVSGSMESQNKLPLVKRSLSALVASLDAHDRIAIVTYAGSTRVALPSTSAREKHTLITAMESLGSGGSTNGAGGIQLAYRTARENFIKEGVNRVVLCTDGDFNVGTTDASSLVQLIEKEAQTGVSLSVLGFGMGNYQDDRMEKLADHGDGNYAYIDTYAEARKVLVEQLTGTLITIAKDVKIQVEFNPAEVQAYRLLGYENRVLAAQDFRNDQKDAGEVGAGHTVTALYEVVPQGVDFTAPEIASSKYQKPAQTTKAAQTGELMNVRIRSQPPTGGEATEREFPIAKLDQRFERASKDFQFAASVAAFGLLLRNSPHKGLSTWDAVTEWATPAVSADPEGYRREFLTLVQKAQQIQLHISQRQDPLQAGR